MQLVLQCYCCHLCVCVCECVWASVIRRSVMQRCWSSSNFLFSHPFCVSKMQDCINYACYFLFCAARSGGALSDAMIRLFVDLSVLSICWSHLSQLVRLGQQGTQCLGQLIASRMSIPLATHLFSRSPHIFCAFCPVPKEGGQQVKSRISEY